jgi:Chondroitinase B
MIDSDAGPIDSGRMDSGTLDSGTPDSGTLDSGTPDSGTLDSGTLDSGTPDSGTPDSGTPDSGTRDAGQVTDGGARDAGWDGGFFFSAPFTSCAVLLDAGLPCSIQFSCFRPIDPRIALLANGYSALVDGGSFIRYVDSGVSLNAAINSADAGDEIVLAAGVYDSVLIDARFKFMPRDRPLIIRGATSDGGVVFRGSSHMRLSGSNIVVGDVAFKGGEFPIANGNPEPVIAVGYSAPNECNGCMLFRVTVDDFATPVARFDGGTTDAGRFLKDGGFASYSDGGSFEVRAFYVLATGNDITIANSQFLNMADFGQMVSILIVPFSNFQLIDSVFRNRFLIGPLPEGERRNGYEAFQIGWSGAQHISACARIEGNILRHSRLPCTTEKL